MKIKNKYCYLLIKIKSLDKVIKIYWLGIGIEGMLFDGNIIEYNVG